MPRPGHAPGLGKKPSELLSKSVTLKMSAEMKLRIQQLAADAGQSEASMSRMLLAASLGDEASQIAVREAGFILNNVRLELAMRLTKQLGAMSRELIEEIFGVSVDELDAADEDAARRLTEAAGRGREAASPASAP